LWLDQKFYAELKNIYFMGTEIQPNYMGAPTYSSKILYQVWKSIPLGVFKWNWKSFLHLFSKFNRKHVKSFIIRKYSCGYATHFLYFIFDLPISISISLRNWYTTDLERKLTKKNPMIQNNQPSQNFCWKSSDWKISIIFICKFSLCERIGRRS
jgi:hypothetical protein